jgi:hypothetical protein
METYIYFAYAGLVSRLIPLGIGATRWRVLDRGGRLLIVVILLSVAGDLVMFRLGRVLRMNNLWVSHLLIGLQTPLLVLVLREWATHDRLRRALGIGSVVAAIGWLVVTISIESPDRFARVTGPLQAALLCLAAIAILVNRGLASEGALTRANWFWVCLGVLLLYGLTAVYRPLLDLFASRGVASIPGFTVLKALASLQVLTNLLYARALFLGTAVNRRAVPAPA